MQNPASPASVKRVCPTCNRPVEPGYKFCETCGTQIAELSTCSKCGTQFIVPVNYCDLCGAPVNVGVEPEPDDSPESPAEQNNGPVEDQLPEGEEKEIPEPVLEPVPDEVPEYFEKTIIPDKDKIPHRIKGEILEPDTDALLKQFGAEYDVKETLESSRKQKPENTDDPLFFSQGKQKARPKPQVNTTRIIAGFFLVAAIIAAVYFIGLPVLLGNGVFGAHGNQTAANITPVPTIFGTITPVPVKTPILPHALIPQPTQIVPNGQNLNFHVQKNPITAKISVIFTGSAGEGGIKSAEIKVTQPDGSISSGIILPLKGVTEITLGGSKEADRVEITAMMSSGVSYRVYDELVPL